MCAPLVADLVWAIRTGKYCLRRADRLCWRCPVVDDNGASVPAFCPSGLFSADQLAPMRFLQPAVRLRQPGTGFHRCVFRGDVGSDHGIDGHHRPRYGTQRYSLWRAILQWLGGIGIIVMSIAILPMLKIGGNQLFQTESSDSSERCCRRSPRSPAGSGSFIALTAACAALLWFSAERIDAIDHAMTTIATGGFSTRDGSIGALMNPRAEVIITCFMLLGALPFVLYLQALRGKPLLLWRDNQVRWFFFIVAFFVLSVAAAHHINNDINLGRALREAAFNVTSIMTGTGYASANYAGWGSFATGVFFFIMFIGGCAGSTTC